MKIRFVFAFLHFAVVMCFAMSARAGVERFAVVIGNNIGGVDDQELRYAETDAMKMHDTFKALGGVPPANLVLLKGETSDVVRRTLITVNDRIRAATRDHQSMLLVYYSGHADATNLHLGKTTLPIEEVEQIVRGSSAELRLLILDSCKSGALTRVKGGTAAPPVDIRMEGALQGEGVLFWTASAANEDAQESDALKGSFFSHFLTSALVGAGDADADGKVTVEEAYRYASENTIRVTSTSSGGTQHPTFRYDMWGQGKVALTMLWDATQHRGALTLPFGKPYLVFSGSKDGPVVAEIGAQDRARRISVKPGTYFVRGRGPDSLLEGTVRVEANEARDVKESELSRTAYARLVRKGAGGRTVSHAIHLGALGHTALANATSWCIGPYVGFGIDWEPGSFSTRAGACRGDFEGNELAGSTDEVLVAVRLTKAIDIGAFSPYAGAELAGTYFYQHFRTQVKRAPDNHTFGGSGSVLIGASLDLGGGFDLTVETALSLYLFPLEKRAETALHAAPAFRPSFGVAKTW